MRDVQLVGVAGDAGTQRVLEQLASVQGFNQEYSPCPPSLGEVVCLPFMRDENGRGYFGVAAIETYVAKHRQL